MLNSNKFTLVEIALVLIGLVLLASLTSESLVSISRIKQHNQFNTAVLEVEKAILGDKHLRDFDGSYIPNGFYYDTGRFPKTLNDLLKRPEDINEAEHFPLKFNDNNLELSMSVGWNGPYVSESKLQKLEEILNLHTNKSGDIYLEANNASAINTSGFLIENPASANKSCSLELNFSLSEEIEEASSGDYSILVFTPDVLSINDDDSAPNYTGLEFSADKTIQQKIISSIPEGQIALVIHDGSKMLYLKKMYIASNRTLNITLP